jgi:glyoxylase-like metal-dependent hydrolase (beta-lactamase superfamily II)
VPAYFAEYHSYTAIRDASTPDFKNERKYTGVAKQATHAKQVTAHVYAVEVEPLSVFLIVLPDGLTLIDAGFPGTMARVEEAVRSLGRRPEEIRDVLVTHCHPDHAAGLAEVRKATGAQAWMHPADAAMVRAGKAFRPWKPSPGLKNRIVARLIIGRAPQTYDPTPVDKEVLPGETIPVAGGLEAIGTPGHTAGHLVFLWPEDGGVLFVGDAANGVGRLKPSPIYEDFAQGLESLRSLGGLDFEVACLAHGAPIVGGAAQAFRREWGQRS